MKTPLLLLALACARPAYAQIDGPDPVKPDPAKYYVFDSNKSACDGGVVVARRAEASKPKGSMNVSVPLYCMHLDDKGRVLNELPIPKDKLQLSVIVPVIGDPVYNLQSGTGRGSHVTPKEAQPSDFTPGAPPPPPPDQQHTPPTPPPHRQPNPRPRQPEPREPVPTTPGPHLPFALRPSESNWLDFPQYADYITRLEKLDKQDPNHQWDKKHWILYDEFRIKLQANLPPALVPKYQAEIAKPYPTDKDHPQKQHKDRLAYQQALSDAVQAYKYADDDKALNDAEKKRLTPDILKAYDAARSDAANKVDDGERNWPADLHTPKDLDEVIQKRKDIANFRITTDFRTKLTPDLPLPPPGQPVPPAPPAGWDPSHDLASWPTVDHNFQKATGGLFSDDEWKTYNDKIAAAKTNEDKDAVVKQYLKLVVDHLQKDPRYNGPDAKKSLDEIKSKIFANMSKWQKQAMCSDVQATAMSAGGDVRPAPTNTAAVDLASGKNLDTGRGNAATANTVQTQIDKIKADGAGRPGDPAPTANASVTAPTANVSLAGPASTPVQPGTAVTKASPIYSACLGDPDLNAGTTPTASKPPPMPDTMPAGTKAGTESDAAPSKPDPNIMDHVRSGGLISMLGMIFGIAGGPVGMLVGAAIGFGVGYLGDKYVAPS